MFTPALRASKTVSDPSETRSNKQIKDHKQDAKGKIEESV